MATRKSCACSAMGEKASRIMWPSSGLIQSGREAWSGLRCSHEKSRSWNICDTRASCCRLCAVKLDSWWASSCTLWCRASASLRVSALTLILAPRVVEGVSGGD